MSLGIGNLLSRYSIVVLLPIFVVGSIYADYSHTQEWKKSLKKVSENDLPVS